MSTDDDMPAATGSTEAARTTADREQPEWIWFQTLAATTVRDMLEAERRRNFPLRSPAARLGVDPTP